MNSDTDLGHRFFAKVEFPSLWGTCWLWRGAVKGNGYGHMAKARPDGTPGLEQVHRVAWELSMGPIPPGLVIDHLCRVKKCVNPQHLEPVTQAINLFRARRTHCKRGHEFTPENEYWAPKGKSRGCRECARLLSKRRIRGWENGKRTSLGVRPEV